MRLIFASAIIALSTGSAVAGCDQWGNCYNNSGSSRSYGGTTTTYGNNYGSGSSWSNSYTSGGNQYGTDRNGNSWSYNRNSGTYYNYGTGQSRYRGQRY